jgi:hypothetical protein
MNKLIRQFERESHIDVYGLGLDRAKWEAALEKYTELIVRECAEWVKNTDPNPDIGEEDAKALLEHFGVEE